MTTKAKQATKLAKDSQGLKKTTAAAKKLTKELEARQKKVFEAQRRPEVSEHGDAMDAHWAGYFEREQARHERTFADQMFLTMLQLVLKKSVVWHPDEGTPELAWTKGDLAIDENVRREAVSLAYALTDEALRQRADRSSKGVYVGMMGLGALFAAMKTNGPVSPPDGVSAAVDAARTAAAKPAEK